MSKPQCSRNEGFMRKNAIAVLALLGALFSSTASAVPITWTLSANLANVSFGPQTLTGTFVYDADDALSATNGYSSVNVLNSGAGYPSVTESIVVPLFTSASQLTATSALAIDAPAFFISFASALTNAGGTIALDVGFPGLGLCADAACNGFSYVSEVTSGQITTEVPDEPNSSNVPEPSTILLLGAGLMGIVAMRKKEVFNQ